SEKPFLVYTLAERGSPRKPWGVLKSA
ncbi:hypothetical protein CMV_030340, partial [Castanea mollissima]